MPVLFTPPARATVEVFQVSRRRRFSTFRERVRAKHNKQIGGGVLLGNKGLDDGLDHTTTRIIVPHT